MDKLTTSEVLDTLKYAIGDVVYPHELDDSIVKDDPLYKAILGGEMEKYARVMHQVAYFLFIRAKNSHKKELAELAYRFEKGKLTKGQFFHKVIEISTAPSSSEEF